MTYDAKVYRVKHLSDSGLNRLKVLERELGYCLVAFESAAKPAALSEEELKKLREMENEIGAVLVAYSCDPE